MAKIPYSHVPIQQVGELPAIDYASADYKSGVRKIKEFHRQKFFARKSKSDFQKLVQRCEPIHKKFPVRVKDAAVAAGKRRNNGEKRTPDPTTIYSAVATDFDAGVTIAIAAWAILVTLKWIKRSVR